MKVKIKKLHQNAIIPTYATDGSACFDLHAIDVGGVSSHGSAYLRTLGANKVFHTGLSFEIPTGFVMLIFSRSGHGFNFDTRLSNCVGVIDSDYRGEVLVKLRRDIWVQDRMLETLVIKNGDRIAQAMIIPIPKIELVESDELTDTSRGNGGFGSTGD